MDIAKYLKNKDITVTNEDFDIAGITSELQKGLVDSKEATKGMVNKSELDALNTKYAELESNYNSTVGKLNDTNDRVARVTLEKEMIGAGFKEDKFEEISKLRTSLFAEEKDDKAAIAAIADKFKSTYFPEVKPTAPTVPNEPGFQTTPTQKPNQELQITRKTRFGDFIKKS